MIEQILKAIYIPQDKANHFVYGVVFFAISHHFYPSYALYSVIAMGVMKELYDLAANYLAFRKGRQMVHGVDVFDALATIAGGAVGYLCMIG